MTECHLYINDTPKRSERNGHHYDAEKMNVVAVSFVAADGTSVRASFNPMNGKVSVQDLPQQTSGPGWPD